MASRARRTKTAKISASVWPGDDANTLVDTAAVSAQVCVSCQDVQIAPQKLGYTGACSIVPWHATDNFRLSPIHGKTYCAIRAQTSSPPTTAAAAGDPYGVSRIPFGPAERTQRTRSAVGNSAAATLRRIPTFTMYRFPHGSGRSG